MKNVINYFYNFNIDNIRMIGDNYYFVYRNQNFLFQEIKDPHFDYQAIFELNKILVNNKRNFYQIVLNKNNEVLTYNSNKRYILMIDNSVLDKDFDYLDILDINIPVNENNKIIDRLNRFNWVRLWENKIDYFELFIDHNVNKYPNLNKYANYFIGMGEVAILYVKDTLKDAKPNNYDNLVISHRRITSSTTLRELYNPVNLVIDHPVRDLVEYLKMLFLAGIYKNIDIKELIDQIALSNYGARLLIARMLFPSFFFDSFEKLIDNKLEEKDIIYIINHMNAYEEFVVEIYNMLKEKYFLPEIDWLKKVDYSSTLTTPKTSGTSFINIDSMPSLSVTSIMLQ